MVGSAPFGVICYSPAAEASITVWEPDVSAVSWEQEVRGRGSDLSVSFENISNER